MSFDITGSMHGNEVTLPFAEIPKDSKIVFHTETPCMALPNEKITIMPETTTVRENASQSVFIGFSKEYRDKSLEEGAQFEKKRKVINDIFKQMQSQINNLNIPKGIIITTSEAHAQDTTVGLGSRLVVGGSGKTLNVTIGNNSFVYIENGSLNDTKIGDNVFAYIFNFNVPASNFESYSLVKYALNNSKKERDNIDKDFRMKLNEFQKYQTDLLKTHFNIELNSL